MEICAGNISSKWSPLIGDITVRSLKETCSLSKSGEFHDFLTPHFVAFEAQNYFS
jgi:hypothetical protein